MKRFHNQADRHRMKAFIAARLPEEGCRVVLAEGEGGEVWAELNPIWDHEDGWDLHWETNEPDAIGLREIYDHFRWQDMTVQEWRRELAVRPCDKVVAHDGIAPSPKERHRPNATFAELTLLEDIVGRLARMEKMLSLARVKETYTAEEAAAQVGKSPWVVRQWCNKEQVPGAYKIQTGRGKKGEWRIPHESLVRLQNEGPLPIAE